MKGWTEKYVKQLKDEGKIRDYKIIGTKTLENSLQQPTRNIPKKRSKEKSKLAWDLKIFCEENSLLLVPECSFHKYRKWRFDFGIFRGVTLEQVKRLDWNTDNQVAAVEYEGILDGGKAHTSVSGVLRDIEKYGAAQALKWIVIRVTAKDYETVLQQLRQYL